MEDEKEAKEKKRGQKRKGGKRDAWKQNGWLERMMESHQSLNDVVIISRLFRPAEGAVYCVYFV